MQSRSWRDDARVFAEFLPVSKPGHPSLVVPLWNTRQSQLPCKTLERCPSAVRLHPSASLPRASTTSRGRRSTNDGRGTPARPRTGRASTHRLMRARPVDVERGGAPRGPSRDARIRRERVQSPTRRIVPTRSRRTSPRAHRTARRSARVFHFTVGVFGRGSGSMSAGDGRRVRRRSTSRCALRLDRCARKTRDTRRTRRDAPIRPSRASNRDSPPIPLF